MVEAVLYVLGGIILYAGAHHAYLGTARPTAVPQLQFAGMYLLLAIAMRALLNRIGRRLFGFRHLTPAPRRRLSSPVLKEAHS